MSIAQDVHCNLCLLSASERMLLSLPVSFVSLVNNEEVSGSARANRLTVGLSLGRSADFLSFCGDEESYRIRARPSLPTFLRQ
jgi:hypothetical protein